MDLDSFLRTRVTKQLVPREFGILSAREIFRDFDDITWTERLAKLALISAASTPDFSALTTNDTFSLRRGKYLTHSKDCQEPVLTLKTEVARNMLLLESPHLSDLSISLIEPFEGIAILESIHQAHRLKALAQEAS